MDSGTSEDRRALFGDFGIELAYFVASIIKENDLSEQGGVSITGWSLGVTFCEGIIAAIHHVDPDTRRLLQEHVTSFILWDPACCALGVPHKLDHTIPLLNRDINQVERQRRFLKWVAGYWNHGDLSTKNDDQLAYEEPGQSPKSTALRLTKEGMDSITYVDESTAHYDGLMINPIELKDPLSSLRYDALFEGETRGLWPKARFSVLWGTASPYPIIAGVWLLEKEHAASTLPMTFITLEGSNQFVMLDEPDLCIESLLSCM